MSDRPNALEEAERAGFDLALIEANLRRSYEERVLLHDRALSLLLELEQAGYQVTGRIRGVITLQDIVRATEALAREKDLLAARERA